MTKRAKTHPAPKRAKTSSSAEKLPLSEHLKEFRRRLSYIAACVAIGAGVAYGFEHQLIAALLRPSHGQDFIYTSPMGGINFLFTICLYVGLVVATPVIIYQLLAFLSPLMRGATHRYLLLAASAAGIVAAGGVAFGYFIGLPSALHFLLHQFTTIQVRPLITIQSYVSFVGLYLLGSALMFQLPLILLFINRIKPLTPGGLFKYERYLVVFAFLAAFIMNPTPNLVSQMVVVVPIIVMYQVGIGLIWLRNRQPKLGRLEQLLAEDAQRQAERSSKRLRPLLVPAVATAPALAPARRPAAVQPLSPPRPGRLRSQLVRL